jgi:hypothetical protein
MYILIIQRKKTGRLNEHFIFNLCCRGRNASTVTSDPSERGFGLWKIEILFYG